MEQHTIKVPDVGEGVAEAELVELLVKVGDVVGEDDVLVAVMTDKATVEIPSPYAGTVEWIGAEVGDKIAVGSNLVRLAGTSKATLEEATTAPSKAPEASMAAASPKSGPDHKLTNTVSTRLVTSAGNAQLKASVSARPLAAPSVRRRAREAGLDLKSVGGTGPGGRILHEDVDRSLSSETTRVRDRVKTVTEIKVVGLRRKIAEKMSLSKSRIPHITIVEEVDVTAIEELRASLNRQLADKGRLTILPFLMKAMAKALDSQPQLNALFDDERGVILRHSSIDIGIATQTTGGLVVPVVRAVEDKSVFECASEVDRLAGRARDGSATREELMGSTITITSLGALGAIATTPVINYPEVAIVGVNRMAIRPIWNGSAFMPRKMMNLSSSFDHRIIDGWDAAIFVQGLKNSARESRRNFYRFEVMTEISCKLLVIGAGPGGYVCAIRAGQLGIDTVLVESGKVGGTCLNVGCIPSKALIHAADEFFRLKQAASSTSALGLACGFPSIDFARTFIWKDGIVRRLNSGVSGLLKRARVRIVQGRASFKDGKAVTVVTDTGPKEIRAEAIVIATGSVPAEVPAIPFGGSVISSTEALALESIPRRIAVIGGGYIGLELGTAFAKLGAKVTIVEGQKRILPIWGEDISGPVSTRLEQLGVEVLLGAQAIGKIGDDALLVRCADGAECKVDCDKILVTAGRRPSTHGLGLDRLVLDMNGSFIRITDKCETSMRGIFAIGDVTGEPMLAHRAMAQGEMVAENIAGGNRVWDKRCVPAVCFTDPEIVTVGLSPEEARGTIADIRVSTFPFTANGRAMTVEDEIGFVQVVADGANNEIIGVQAVGRGISELSAAFSIAIEMGARLEDIGSIIHAHPTLSETFQEAALRGLGHAIHI